MVFLPAAWSETGVESSLTNKPIDYNSTILVPQPAIPGMIVPQAVPVNIPSGSNTAPPASRTKPKGNSPFRFHPGPVPPSANDIASRLVEIVAPPLPELAPATVVLPEETNAEPVTPHGGKFRYVALTGSDKEAGTKVRPWKTIQRAAATAQPGDLITVLPGTYEAFHTVRGGETNRPITFLAQGAVVIIPQGGAAPAGMQPTTMAEVHRLDNIHVRNTDHIIIDGFQVQRAGRCGISVIEANGVILRRNIIGPVGRFGILTGFATDVQIISNKTFGAAAEHGIYVSNSRVTNDNPVIRYNETYDNRGNGIQINGDCGSGGDGSITGALVEGNVVHDNGLKGLSLISMSDSVVQNNLIYNNAKTAGAGGIHLTDEIGCGKASSGNVVVNNTVVEPRMACIRITDGAKNNILFNNLLVGSRPLIDEVNDNQIDPNSNLRLNSVIGVFNDSEAGDFHPLITSPAKNTGVSSYREKRAPLFDREGNRRRAAIGLDVGAY